MLEFQAQLYNTPAAMHDAIAAAWMTGDGQNDAGTIAELLNENSDGLLAIECRAHWNLDANTEFQPELLVDALARFRRTI